MSMTTEMVIDDYLGRGYSKEQLEKEMETWSWKSEEEHKNAIRYLYEESPASNVFKLPRRERRRLQREQLKAKKK